VLERETIAPTIVVDTSVVAKWYVQHEPDRSTALAIRDAFVDGRIVLAAPATLLPELANALRYHADFDAARVAEAIESCAALDVTLVPCGADLLRDAVRLSYQHDVAVYDALFLALADAVGADYVTADERFTRKLRSLEHVRWLRTYRVPDE
jgi:predicted nucleic acid-binding protein